MVDFNKQSKPQHRQQFKGVCSSGDVYNLTLRSWPSTSHQVAVCKVGDLEIWTGSTLVQRVTNGAHGFWSLDP